MVSLAATCGTRWGETVALRSEDVDTSTRTIQVRRTAVEKGSMGFQAPKNGRYRATFYPESLAADVGRLCNEAATREPDGGSTLLFPTREGTVLRRSNFHRRYWQTAREAAGWESGWSFHTLRHCAAVWMI